MTDYTDLQKAAEYGAQDVTKFADEDEEMRALQQFHEEVDPESVLALIAENKRLRESDQEATELCDTLSALLGKIAVAVRGPEEPKSRHGFNDLPSRVKTVVAERDQLKAENEALRKDADRLQSATAFVQKLCDSAGKQPSVATGYLHDILSAMGRGEQS